MTTLGELKLYASKMADDYPDHYQDIWEMYYLAETEVESGESVLNEISLCVTAIDDLVL